MDLLVLPPSQSRSARLLCGSISVGCVGIARTIVTLAEIVCREVSVLVNLVVSDELLLCHLILDAWVMSVGAGHTHQHAVQPIHSKRT